MGSSVPRPSKSSPLNLQDYQEVITNHSDPYFSIPNRRIIRNKFTNLQLEQYNMEFVNQDAMNKYYEVFYWRMTQQYIARTLHFFITKQSECCSDVCRARVYTERVVIRLSDIKDIPFPQNLYIILATADAFDKIVEKIGFFDIQENMIGVNSKGEIRVWISEDSSSNTLDVESYECKTEKQMAKRLVKIINQNTQIESQPTSFEAYVNSRCSSLSFYDLMVLVKQYAKINKVNIPINFSSAIEAVKYDPSFASRTIQNERSISRLSDASGSKYIRKRQHIQPPVQIVQGVPNQMNQMRSFPQLLSYEVGTPRFQKMPSFVVPEHMVSDNSQRKYLIGDQVSPKVTEVRRMIPVVEQQTTHSISRFYPNMTPLSKFSTPVRNKERSTQGTRIISEKPSNQLIHTDRKPYDSSADKNPYSKTGYKNKGQYISTSPFEQSRYPKEYYRQPETLERIPSVENKLQQYFETASIHQKELRTYKNKTMYGRQYGKQVSPQKPYKGSFDRKMMLKDKYEMNPQIARDLKRFYHNH